MVGAWQAHGRCVAEIRSFRVFRLDEKRGPDELLAQVSIEDLALDRLDDRIAQSSRDRGVDAGVHDAERVSGSDEAIV